MDRTVVVRLVGMVGQYRAAMAQAAQATTAAQGTITRANTAMAASAGAAARAQAGAFSGMASTMRSMRGMLLGLGLPLAIGALAKSFLDFERKMAHVKAVADELGRSAPGFKALSDAALTAGQKFGFTAVEVASAQEALLKAGRSTSQVLGGELTAALTLAAAGTISLDDAATITATTMTIFKDQGISAVQVANQLTGAANETVSGVQEMGTALSYVGPVAASLGVSFEETVATISVFNQAGIEADRAGTNLRGMLTNLLSPSAMARAEMTRLGIDLFDAEGKFVGLAKTADILANTVGKLGGRDKAEAVGRLTTNASMPGFIVLMEGGAKVVRDMEAAIKASATAQEVAAKKLDSLTGQLDKFASAASSAAIKVGGALAPALENVAKTLTGVVTGFGNMGGAAQLAVLALGAQLLMARRVRTAMTGTAGSIKDTTTAYRQLYSGVPDRPMNAAGQRFIGPMLPLAPGADGRLKAITNEASGATRQLGHLVGSTQAATGTWGKFRTAGIGAMTAIRASASSLMSFMGGPWGVAIAAGFGLFMLHSATVQAAKQRVDDLKTGLMQLGMEYARTGQVSADRARELFAENEQMQKLINHSERYSLSIDTITRAATGQRGAVDAVLKQMDSYIGRLQKFKLEVGTMDEGEADAEAKQLGITSDNGWRWLGEDTAYRHAVEKRIQLTNEERKAFEELYGAELKVAEMMQRIAKDNLDKQLKKYGYTADEASEATKALMTNLSTMSAAESDFSDRIKAMASNVDMLAGSFYGVADAQAAFYAASRSLADAFSEDIPGGGGGGGGREYGVTRSTDEDAATRFTPGKPGSTTTKVIKGGKPPKKPVKPVVEKTENADGTTTTKTTTVRADGTKVVTTKRSALPAKTERERTRRETVTDRRPDGTTIVTTTTTDAEGNKSTETRRSFDPADARKAEKKAGPTTRKVAAAVDEVTGQFDVTTARGAKQHEAMTKMADATGKTVVEVFNQVAFAGGKTEDAMHSAGLAATAAFIKQRDAAVQALTATGMGIDKAKALADAYYAMPQDMALRLNAQGAEDALELLRQIRVEVVTLPHGQLGMVTDAPERAKELEKLGGKVAKLKGGKFKVTFTNQKELNDALEKLVEARRAEIIADAKTGKAKGDLDETAEARGAKIIAEADSRVAEAMLEWVARDRDVKIYIETIQAQKDLARGERLANQDAQLADAVARSHQKQTKPSYTNIPGKGTLVTFPDGTTKWKPMRWGGISARSGALRDATIGMGGPLYQWAERETGGEAFVPRHGKRDRSMAILGQAASWYGAKVSPAAAPAWSGQKLSSAAPGQVQITVRGEGVLSGMIEATVDGRLVKVAQTVANRRVR